MSNKYHPANWNVGTKISAFSFALVGLIIAALILAISVSTAALLEERASDNMQDELHGVVNTIDMFNRTVSAEAVSFGRIFGAEFGGSFEADATAPIDIDGKPVPALKHDGKVLNLDFSAPDRFSGETGGNATIFVVDGDDFVRVSTSVKKENGERAVGTRLDRASPAYAAIKAGKVYVGLATLFGKQFITQYAPVRDAGGKVVGALYVGVDISAEAAALKERIRAIKVGDTGYFYVLNAAPGKGEGDLLVHPTREGQNILAERASNGRAFVREILDRKTGTLVYDWQNPGETATREKIVSFAFFKDWNWVIVGGTYRDEITAHATALRNQYIVFGLVALSVFAAILYAFVRATITRPLATARDAAARIAGGDLTVQVERRHADEIGLLLDAMNGISRKLSSVVGKVRDGAEQIANASNEISTGNLDLCARTEQQAGSLAATSSSMGELTETVRQNAEHARQANSLAVSASTIAQKGGSMVGQVVETMESINQSSRRIADITGVIDGIAFQTNILALNAAVEAARAGEQGRGFAVVAGEVRNLAQRSAAAAREIKTLIAASSAEVDAGRDLVSKAGATMHEVLASVGRVTDIMADITAASLEQSSGIEQVNRAIGEMDDSTRHNAALVEEASAAAQAMQDQAAELARAVRLFRLDEGVAAVEAPAPRLALTAV
ncbi:MULTISPECIES: Cache 3/Cache 2 fusion domain-containing protein [unclassified Massilia]|uniref:methyl-accepting chemotaxis protein n=1 Tax=unclassified Massilia TaxID=2609279 RepID=UPI00177CD71F|nr:MULTISPECIES: Cache 3/Cache 2 fusion domain-containing protein [unclassified Massilia]MBD8529405.1 Cache 3/Cache 2 fusion domain-containing protein [Massilia sp. CFBP 13647]MBD8672798.1 Cache 3/Cache 2 fusion domain-containing protein [Massilia sp. CFBP 13721]